MASLKLTRDEPFNFGEVVAELHSKNRQSQSYKSEIRHKNCTVGSVVAAKEMSHSWLEL